MYKKQLQPMELYIKTLTGVSLEVVVSPSDKVYDVKYRIQKREGIPVSQQHLIWHSEELEDTRFLRDYHIHNGATLQLVLSMRGGPVSTRRVPVSEEPTLSEMAEYLCDASRSDLSPSNQHLPMLIVYRAGDHLNFYRVVDRDVASSLSYSIGGPSECHPGEESPLPKERCEENDKTREKMRQIKSQLQNLNLVKEQKEKKIKKLRAGRLPSSRAASRLRRYSPLEDGATSALNKHRPLPPITKLADPASRVDAESSIFGSENKGTEPEPRDSSARNIISGGPSLSCNSASDNCVTIPDVRRTFGLESDCSQPHAPAEIETETAVASETRLLSDSDAGEKETAHDSSHLTRNAEALGVGLLASALMSRSLSSATSVLASLPPSSMLEIERTVTSATERVDCCPKASGAAADDSRVAVSCTPSCGVSEFGSANAGGSDEAGSAIAVAVSSVLGLSASPTRRGAGSRSGIRLQSLNVQEVQAVSGMLSTIVRNHSRIGGMNGTSAGTSTTIVETTVGLPASARIKSSSRKLSASHSSSRVGSSVTKHRLPSVKVTAVRKKSARKRCAVCGKKTRLAMSFQCRCGNNFCAIHRYAESHACTFDYRTEGRKLLEQSNPVVAAPKLPKI